MVLERGEVANSWRRERWDSLRLLTPNWQSRLPGHRYAGDDPDGFMTMPEVVSFLRGYAGFISAPVEAHTVSGEITLTGLVLPVGGLKEKSLAAQRAGIKRVIVPDRNEGEIGEIPKDELGDLEFVYVSDGTAALAAALEPRRSRRR